MRPAILLLMIPAFTFFSCGSKYYTMEDFQEVEKIDAHFHIYTADSKAMEQAVKDNFKLLSINTNSGPCERVVDANNWLKQINAQHPEDMAYTTTFCLDGWDDKGWVENTISWIDQTMADGANSVKVWKNIGMEFRNKDSVLVMIDDPQLDPVFKHLEQKGIPLVGHLGEPKDCWAPVEEMAINNNKNYFTNNPKYHMYLHPEYPSYEEQMSARDRMLERYPDLVFIGCHLASLEWSIDEMSAWFDKFPNASVDIAARIGNLFYHARNDHEKLRNFMIKYQDRIMYGTDMIDRGSDGFQERMHSTWTSDWEFFVTDNTMTSRLIEGEFKGLKLPKKVVDKIYSGNARKWYKSF